ncbi:MAG: hypothetical protein Ct9H300mP23_07450 [Nitrospinota bacterium]|nr:MAG: hypothetical protein Ct9H300mP23_07450 [Nitrospinota bacterium]
MAEVLKQEQNDYFKGAALQRFGHTYDIAIKVIGSIAQGKKTFHTKPREQCFETALENGWLDKKPQTGQKWLKITNKSTKNCNKIQKTST